MTTMGSVNAAIRTAMQAELDRERNTINLIASENYVSEAVLLVSGSILTNKYAEGVPGRRYYGGCRFVDEVENLGIATAKHLFGADHVNIQPHSGSQANAAAYRAVLKKGDRVLAMSLDSGGHLTHGHRANFSAELYEFQHYEVDRTTLLLDYEAIAMQAAAFRPQLIVAGASAYSRSIDFARLREIANSVGALLMVDMAHIAGLVAAGLHQNPVAHAQIVTTTTHKTLRGARGGMILCTQELAKAVDRAVFPGTQGGPLENIIAGKTQALLEASTPEFKTYATQIIANAKALADSMAAAGLEVLAGGTDNHLINVNVRSSFGISGAQAEALLEGLGIVVNKEMLPFDTASSVETSGIRVGTPAMTTRGFTEAEFRLVGSWIASALQDQSEKNQQRLQQLVLELCQRFPLYPDLDYVKE